MPNNSNFYSNFQTLFYGSVYRISHYTSVFRAPKCFTMKLNNHQTQQLDSITRFHHQTPSLDSITRFHHQTPSLESITRLNCQNIFFSHSRSEQFWQQNIISIIYPSLDSRHNHQTFFEKVMYLLNIIPFINKTESIKTLFKQH